MSQQPSELLTLQIYTGPGDLPLYASRDVEQIESLLSTRGGSALLSLRETSGNASNRSIGPTRFLHRRKTERTG